MNHQPSQLQANLRLATQASITTRLPNRLPWSRSVARKAKYGEGPFLLRLLLVLSSLSPLFLLWAIRGIDTTPGKSWWTFHFAVVNPDLLWVLFCLTLFAIPNLFLWSLIRLREDRGTKMTIRIGETDDKRQDIVSYLFAMLLPFYTVNLSSPRDFLATAAAFAIVVILFFTLNLYYMNIFFALRGYHCIQVHTPAAQGGEGDRSSYMVISRKRSFTPGTSVTGFVVSSSTLLVR